MSHQPYETWLFSEERLLPEQAQALREHLRNCEACRRLEQSWSGVQQLFQRSMPTAPAPGFTARWQARLAAEQRRRQRRNGWIMLSVTGGIALVLLLFLGAQALDLFRSPEQILMFLIYRVSSLYIYGQASLQIVPELLRPLVGVLPFTIWLVAIGLASILAVLWIVAYQKIMALWRIRI